MDFKIGIFKILLLANCFILNAQALEVQRSHISEERFEEVRVSLKEFFVERDYEIDWVMDQIQSWVLYPQTRIRPLIIQLWGPTSAGKTELVSQIVERLGLSQNYYYFDMEGFTGDSKYETFS